MSAHVRARDFPTARSIRDAGCYGRLASILGCARLNLKSRSGRRGSELEPVAAGVSRGFLRWGDAACQRCSLACQRCLLALPAVMTSIGPSMLGFRSGRLRLCALQRKRKRGAVWHHGWPPHSPRGSCSFFSGLTSAVSKLKSAQRVQPRDHHGGYQ